LAQKQTNKFNAKGAQNFPVSKNTNTNSESLQEWYGARGKWAWHESWGKSKRQKPSPELPHNLLLLFYTNSKCAKIKLAQSKKKELNIAEFWTTTTNFLVVPLVKVSESNKVELLNYRKSFKSEVS